MKRPADFDCTLAGQVWRVHFVRRNHPKVGKNYGMCYWDDRDIFVRYDVSEKSFIDTLIHELRHGLSRADFCAEEWITDTSTEIAVALIKAGIVVHK